MMRRALVTACGLALMTTGLATAEKPSPFVEQRRELFDIARRDFIRGGHVNVGIIFGGGRDRRPAPAPRYPDAYPPTECGGCDYGRGDDWHREEAKRRAEWRREEAKRRAEWEREAAKRYHEQQREADQRYWERVREDEERFWEQRREARERRFEREGERWER